MFAAGPTACLTLRGELWPLLVGLLVTLVAVPLVRRVAVACQLYDRPDSGLKPHGQPIPYLGGVAMYLGWLATLICAMLTWPACRHGLPWVAVAGTVLMLTGLVDDLRGLKPVLRLLIQAGAAGFLLYGGLGRHLLAAPLHLLSGLLPEWALNETVVAGLSGVACMVILAGATNATNLIDGLDGLCAGIIGIAATGFLAIVAIKAWATGLVAVDSPTAITQAALALALAGICAGFLIFNFNPASIFMGDSGSLLLGFNVAVILILFGEDSSWRWLAGAGIVFGFPVFDTALAISRRWLNRKPLFVGDRSHFYDQIRDRQMSVRKTVLVCYVLGLGFAALGAAVAMLPVPYLIAVLLILPILLAAACRRLGMLRVDDAAERSARPGEDSR